MQDEKSQLQNKAKAMRVLRARLYEEERKKQRAEQDATRRSQIGSGEHPEKIRTYNFAESRVTDHRIKMTQHRLDQVLDGDLFEFTEALTSEDQRRALEGMTVRDLLVAGTEELSRAGVPSPRVDAERLLAHAPRGFERTRAVHMRLGRRG